MSNAAWNLSYADDPTDWDADHAYLKALDSSLRCALCYDIFTAPVAIKDCAHTFCSGCIRRAISKPGQEMGNRCPSCMVKNVYDSSLMPQPALEQAAESWRVARPKLYEEQSKVQALQKQLAEQAASASTSAAALGEDAPARKRARLSPSSHDATSPPRRRSARAEALRAREQSNGTTQILDESGEDSDYLDEEDVPAKQPAKPAAEDKDYRQMKASDMADCPLCGHSFTISALNKHLDKMSCSPSDPEPSLQERGLPTEPNAANGKPGWFQKSSPSIGTPSQSSRSGPSNATPRRKLVRPNYDLVKLPDLKRLLEEQGLASSGDRKRLVERHRMWTHIYNANLDASERMRKSDRDLRRDLQTWERSQDQAATGVSEKRAKTWTADHATDFKRLAQQARETHLRDRQKHKEEQEKRAAAAAAQEPNSVDSVPAASMQTPDTILSTVANGSARYDDRQPSSSPPTIVEP